MKSPCCPDGNEEELKKKQKGSYDVCCSGNSGSSFEDGKCCGDNKTAESDNLGCGCGGTEFPDMSRVARPANPESTAEESFIAELKEYSYNAGIKSVGFASVTPELVIGGVSVEYKNAVVLTTEMDDEVLEKEPGYEAQTLNDLTYERLARITYRISDYLRKNGFATEVAHPYGGLLNFPLLAQKAGLGYIGKSGLLVTPESGPKVKISAVLTGIENLPLAGENRYSWIARYCESCGKCIRKCPESALAGSEKCCDSVSHIIKERCIGCSKGCTYCITECPFYKKGYLKILRSYKRMSGASE